MSVGWEERVGKSGVWSSGHGFLVSRARLLRLCAADCRLCVFNCSGSGYVELSVVNDYFVMLMLRK